MSHHPFGREENIDYIQYKSLGEKFKQIDNSQGNATPIVIGASIELHEERLRYLSEI